MAKLPTIDGYSRFSIIVHWISAILIIALFLTHEGDRGGTAYAFHVGGGAIVGIFLLWRVWHRLTRGMTAKPDQRAIFNLASQIVIWGFLVAIVVTVVSGYLLPWSRGQALDIFGHFAIPSPMEANHGMHEVFETLHKVAGQVFVPLFILHILGAAKHAIIDRDGIFQRMSKATIDGK